MTENAPSNANASAGFPYEYGHFIDGMWTPSDAGNKSGHLYNRTNHAYPYAANSLRWVAKSELPPGVGGHVTVQTPGRTKTTARRFGAIVIGWSRLV
ncbi:putative salicylaldehyde dehydrogenase [Burkholderia lata]|nr:putative salicylaldehyde dehydrogenase [Burkholderia lata]